MSWPGVILNLYDFLASMEHKKSFFGERSGLTFYRKSNFCVSEWKLFQSRFYTKVKDDRIFILKWIVSHQIHKHKKHRIAHIGASLAFGFHFLHHDSNRHEFVIQRLHHTCNIFTRCFCWANLNLFKHQWLPVGNEISEIIKDTLISFITWFN